jgi:hypothetical protein
MALPRVSEARPYYYSAKQRLDDSVFLLTAGRTTGAVYLAGYCVECMLKALILAGVPEGARAQTLASLRGPSAHRFEWLKKLYVDNGGPQLPRDVANHFSLVNTWTTDLRYTPGMVKPSEAETFLQSVREIVAWADGRL